MAEIQAASLRVSDELLVGTQWWFVESVTHIDALHVAADIRLLDSWPSEYAHPIFRAHDILTVMIP